MGVKGLQAYTKQCCPEALVFVKLQELAQHYHRRHGRQPVLIVDGMSLLRKVYNPGIPWVYGGEWLELFECIQAFVETLKEANIRPVFIFDGVVEQSKRATWLGRRKQERRLVGKVFEYIKRTGQHPDKSLYHIPPSISKCFIQAFKHLGVEVFRSSVEADREIFHYYKKHECFGVLTHDSDFLIYDIESYFSTECLDLKHLKVQMYNKQALCHNLGLRPHLLPLLACILGNDTISQGSLAKFHHWVTGTPRNKRLKFQITVPSCARYLASLGIESLTEQTISDLERHIFHQSFMKGVMQQVVNDYTLVGDSRGYSKHQEKTSSSSPLSAAVKGLVPYASNEYNHPQSTKGREMLQQKLAPSARYRNILEFIRKKHGSRVVFLEKVLYLAELDCNMSFEDDIDHSMPSAGILLKPIRQRIYGVLFGIGCSAEVSRGSSQFPEAGNKSECSLVVGVNAVNEYYVYAGYALKDPDVVGAIALDLPGGTPTLEELWMNPEEETLCLRQQAVLSCLYCKIDQSLLLQTLPRHYVALCCLVHYFVRNGPVCMMKESDVDAFIAQAVCISLYTVQRIRDIRITKVEPRAVHLATIFMRGLTTFMQANTACAKPFRMEDMLFWECFDGKLFHFKYLMAQDGASMSVLCENNAQAMEDFQLLKRCITMETRMASTSVALSCLQMSAGSNQF